ncbi:MAG: NAD(P)/FAD-dependent oxidoreductase [Alistipes sp.]|nr:NAD(P)/FAD-dependent oxidoreductase [Alistipes sp.]
MINRHNFVILCKIKRIIMYDVIVIGAGAAGLMAAATAAHAGRSVLLLEKMEKAGRKIRITGKGRCNLTNARPAEEFMDHVRTNAEFFSVAFAEFNNRATIRMFERLGVKLDIERGERVFPRSGKAWDIANALVDYCTEEGVRIEYNTRVKEILTLGSKVYGVKFVNRRGFERKEECDNVIIATGGVSYPATGSTGDGYGFADALGHTIEPVRPSLTPLKTSHPQREYLNGLLLKNVGAKLYIDNELRCEEFGEIGFSERGIEGAVALRISRDAVDALIEERHVKLVLDLKPALDAETLRERIRREMADMRPDEFFAELLRKLVPRNMVVPLAKEVDFHSKSYISKLTDTEIERLIKILKGMVFPIVDYAPFEYAVVTAGGVSCNEVNRYTMESTKVKGVYFAGEVLDIDANTGGYNLQIAFSTGRLAGQLKK